MKRFYVVEWSNVWRDRTTGVLQVEHMIDERVIAEDELDACCKIADKYPEGYGFAAKTYERYLEEGMV